MHEGRFYTFDIDVPKEKIEKYLAKESEYHGEYHNPCLEGPLRFLNKRFNSYDEGVDYINNNLFGNYEQVVVEYLEHQTQPTSPKLLKLHERRATEIRKQKDYANAHSVKSFKSLYIGCSVCGSKLSKNHLRDDVCPLCRNDLRSKTTLETLARYKSNIEKLDKEIDVEIKKINEKRAKSAKVRYLAKIEYHV